MTDIAGNKDPRNARLEVERIAVGGPSAWALAFEHQVLTGDHVTLRIPLDHSGEPIGAGNSARVNHQRTRVHGFRRARFIVLNGDPLAMLNALHRNDTGVKSYFDILRRGDLVFQVLR